MTTRADTISSDYLRLQQELHQNPHYGVASIQFAPFVKQLIEELGVTSLSDYGAGKQNLRRRLEELGTTIDYRPYDPAFAEYGFPQPADLVCCIDVLEHIEPDYLDQVLDELKAITVKYGFFTVHTGPAMKHLADGRNAHLIQEPPSWWAPKLKARFRIQREGKTPGGFAVLVSALPAEG